MKTGSNVGKVTVSKHAVKDYVDHLKSTVLYSLDGLKIAADCANGSASVSAGRLFESLGAECTLLFNNPNGVNINEACGSTHIEALREYVVEHGLDLGVAFDGDADRCLCVDDRGNLVNGDEIMAICALDMKTAADWPKHRCGHHYDQPRLYQVLRAKRHKLHSHQGWRQVCAGGDAAE